MLANVASFMLGVLNLNKLMRSKWLSRQLGVMWRPVQHLLTWTRWCHPASMAPLLPHLPAPHPSPLCACGQHQQHKRRCMLWTADKRWCDEGRSTGRSSHCRLDQLLGNTGAPWCVASVRSSSCMQPWRACYKHGSAHLSQGIFLVTILTRMCLVHG